MHIARHGADSPARSTISKPAGPAPASTATGFGAALKPAADAAAAAPAPVAPVAPKQELGSGLSTLALAGSTTPAA